MATFRRLGTALFVAATLVLVLSVNFASGQVAPETLGGLVTFRDANALSDSVVVSLTGVPAPAAGNAHEGWIVATSGKKTSIGVLSVSSSNAINHTYVSPTGANLLKDHVRFEISLEPDPDTDPAHSGTIAYIDRTPGPAFTHVGHLVVSWPDNPDSKGIATALREQVTVAQQHAVLARNSSDLAGKQQHARHVINIIEGTSGPNFNAAAGNPGNGVGVFKHAQDAIAHANLAKQATEDTNVNDKADEVIEAANRVIDFATQARDSALVVSNATEDNIVTRLELDNAVALLTRALEGTDADGDGSVGATGAEGGANTVYTKSQDIASFTPMAGTGDLSVGDPLVPVVGLSTLLAGFGLLALGGIVLFRRRRATMA